MKKRTRRIARGFHPDVPFDDYVNWPAVNHSVLRHFNRTALHAFQAMNNPKDQTDAQALGHAAHCAILEPDRFEDEYIAAPKFDMRTNAGKRARARFWGKHPDRSLLPQYEYDNCLQIRDAVWAHPTARELLEGKGQNELSALWQDPDTGRMVKARLDRLTKLGQMGVIVDIKTSRNAKRSAFSRDVQTYHYHQQAALYLDGAAVLKPLERKFVFIVLEKEPPYAVAVYELDDEAVQLGRDEYKAHLATYGECIRSGRWPGYGDGMDNVSLPAWAFKAIA